MLNDEVCVVWIALIEYQSWLKISSCLNSRWNLQTTAGAKIHTYI